jgi:hypothetical protein
MASPSPFTIVSAFGQTLVDDADAATARGTLGLGSMATQNSSAVAITGGTQSGVSISSGSISAAAVSGSSINNTPIGSSTPSSAKFTSVQLSSLLDLSTATAGQIKFPATQNPSTNANILDDYTEFNWTPDLFIDGLSTNCTYSSRVGKGRKKGDEVTVWFDIQLATKTTSTGICEIRGMTYNPQPSPTGAFVVSLWTLNSAIYGMVAFIESGSIGLSAITSATTDSSVNRLNGSQLLSNSHIAGFGSYRSSQ